MPRRDVPVSADAQVYGVRLAPDAVEQLAEIARRGRLSMNALCRLALRQLARGDLVSEESILEEAEAVRAEKKAAKLVCKPPARRGRPLKTNPDAQGMKLDRKKVLAIRQRWQEMDGTLYRAKKIAEEMGLSVSTVYAIISRRLWGHLPDEEGGNV